jgi:hypothetical protein
MPRLLILAAVTVALQIPPLGQTDPPVLELLKIHQYDLATEGKTLLEKEARAASFFLIGGLHGDKETPALVDALWSSVGYRYLAAEMSPWAASRLKVSHVRGSDIEELQPHLLIRDLAQANPKNGALQSMVELTKEGYKRTLAPKLLALAAIIGEIKDSTPGGIASNTAAPIIQMEVSGQLFILRGTLHCLRLGKLTLDVAARSEQSLLFASQHLDHHGAPYAVVGGASPGMP